MIYCDFDIVDQILKRERIPGYKKQTFRPPLLISIYLLKSFDYLSDILNDKSLSLYCDYVTNIWRPNPQLKEKETKEHVKMILPKILSLLYGERKKIFKELNPVPSLTYANLKHKFIELEGKIQDSIDDNREAYKTKSNPFITISIGESLEQGKKFQLNAKLASSIETKWGSWIESVIPLFNQNIVKIGAGEFDVILNDTAYDIKSGPNVMNKTQVAGALIKRDQIRQMSSYPEFAKIVNIRDFKVATAYGKRSSAKMYMQNEKTGLILFAADTWRKLTGDEWNAYRLFNWQLQHQIQTKKWTPNKDTIIKSMEIFFESSYDQYREKMNEALQKPEYLELIKF